MKIQKIILWVLVLALLLSVSVGCVEEEVYAVMDEVVIDFTVTDVVTDDFTVQYNAETWTYDDTTEITMFYDNTTIENTTGLNNVNIINTKEPGKIDNSGVESITAEFSSEEVIASGMALEKCEVLTLGESPVLYVEQVMTLTDAAIALYIEQGLLVKEILENPEALEMLKKPTYSMAIYISVDNELVIITGTYYDVDAKSTTLNTMKLFAQTLSVE